MQGKKNVTDRQTAEKQTTERTNNLTVLSAVG